MDNGLHKILIDARQTIEHATQIRDFLRKVLHEDQSGTQKFNDAILQEAAELIENIGPGAFYWMTDIADQMTTLAQCAIRDIPTNVDAELGKDASAEEIIKSVVRV